MSSAIYKLLTTAAQAELSTSITEEKALARSEKTLDSNIFSTQQHLMQSTRAWQVKNHAGQCTQTLFAKKQCEGKRGEITNEIERKWQMLREQHHRTKFFEERELQTRLTNESRGERDETDEHNTQRYKRYGE